MAKNGSKNVLQKKQEQKTSDQQSSESSPSPSSTASSTTRRRAVVSKPDEDEEGPNLDEPASKTNSNRHLLVILRRHSAIFRHRRLSRRGFKSCCFCCFCCCSCSCTDPLLQKSGAQSKNIPQDTMVSNFPLLSYDPSLEEVRSWGESFDRLMKSSAGRELFRQFLQCEYSEENILFWLACEDLKKELNPDAVEEKAKVIYENYVSILSPREVNIDSRVRGVVDRKMDNPTVTTFDEAQLQIYTLMRRDSYPRFLLSSVYRQVAQLSPHSSKTSVSAH